MVRDLDIEEACPSGALEVAVTTALVALTFLVTLKDPGKPSAVADRGT